MHYDLSIVSLALLAVSIVIFFMQTIRKDDDIICGAIKYGCPNNNSGTHTESMFQVLLATNARLEDKMDHTVLYGAIEKDLVYLRDIPENVMNNVVYGKFYDCNVYYGSKGQIDYVELKGV